MQPELLARGVCRLEAIEMGSTDISREQAQAVFAAIARERTLTRLCIGFNNLSTVQPADMAIAVNRLEKVDMSNTQLATHQVNCILRQCVEGDTKLKMLWLWCDNMDVDQDIFRRAVEKLGDGLKQL